jgi:hypothetical protein
VSIAWESIGPTGYGNLQDLVLVGLHRSVRWSIGQAVGSIPAGIAAWVILVMTLTVVRHLLDRSSGSPSREGRDTMRSAPAEVLWSIGCNLAGGVLLPTDERTDPFDDSSDGQRRPPHAHGGSRGQPSDFVSVQPSRTVGPPEKRKIGSSSPPLTIMRTVISQDISVPGARACGEVRDPL